MKDYRIFFSAFVFFFLMFFKWESLNPTYIGWASNVFTILFALMNLPLLLKFNIKKYKWINIAFLSWTIVAIIAVYNNQNVSYDVMKWSSIAQTFVVDKSVKTRSLSGLLYYVTSVIFYALYFQKLNRINKSDLFLKYLFWIMLPFIIISDINGFTYHSEGISGYQVGNKFYLCYSNVFLATIYLLRRPIDVKQNRTKVKVLLLITFLLSIKTGCTTMIIGSLFYYFMIFTRKQETFLYKPLTYIITLFVCDILFFVAVTWIMTLPIVQYVVVDILGEDLTLTGRLGMYERLGDVLTECPLYGFGIGNASMTTTMYLIGDNAQNGLFNLFIECGFIGTIIYLVAILLLLRKTNGEKFYYPIICFIYMMLLLSTIEVTFTPYFTAIIMLLLLNNKDVITIVR